VLTLAAAHYKGQQAGSIPEEQELQINYPELLTSCDREQQQKQQHVDDEWDSDSRDDDDAELDRCQQPQQHQQQPGQLNRNSKKDLMHERQLLRIHDKNSHHEVEGAASFQQFAFQTSAAPVGCVAAWPALDTASRGGNGHDLQHTPAELQQQRQQQQLQEPEQCHAVTSQKAQITAARAAPQLAQRQLPGDTPAWRTVQRARNGGVEVSSHGCSSPRARLCTSANSGTITATAAQVATSDSSALTASTVTGDGGIISFKKRHC
jgi:hypothetical protein